MDDLKVLNYTILSIIILNFIGILEIDRITGLFVAVSTISSAAYSIFETKVNPCKRRTVEVLMAAPTYLMIGYAIGTVCFNIFVMVI